MDNDLKETAWFAGFTDGEGCFVIYKRPGHGFAICFSIGLRADNIELLSELKTAFGGHLSFGMPTPKALKERPGSNPSWQWQIVRRTEVIGLINYFDKFPLQSRKHAEYEVWREAALFYYRHSTGSPTHGGKFVGRNPAWLVRLMESYTSEIKRLKQYEAQPISLELELLDNQLPLDNLGELQ